MVSTIDLFENHQGAGRSENYFCYYYLAYFCVVLFQINNTINTPLPSNLYTCLTIIHFEQVFMGIRIMAIHTYSTQLRASTNSCGNTYDSVHIPLKNTILLTHPNKVLAYFAVFDITSFKSKSDLHNL